MICKLRNSFKTKFKLFLHTFLALVVAKLPAAKKGQVFTILYCISNTSKALYLCLLCSHLLTWLWNSQKYRAYKNLGVYSIICYHSATQLLQKWQSQKEKNTNTSTFECSVGNVGLQICFQDNSRPDFCPEIKFGFKRNMCENYHWSITLQIVCEETISHTGSLQI